MSWQKVKLGDLCIIEKGKTGIQKAISGEYPLVVTAEDRKSHNEYQFDNEAVIIPLVSGTGHGHASIKRLHFQSGKFALGSILCAVIPKDKSILNTEYLFHFLNLNKERELVDRMKGMANVTLPIKEIAKIEIPLPTLEEQIEFVEKYSLLETDSDDISSELTHQLDLINQLRQAFLREAMQGKLVKSNNPKETGQQLLAKIKAEKINLIAEKKLKKEKELPSITDEEISFEIPEYWTWCRLRDICTIKGGKRVPNGYSLLKKPTPYVYLRVSDMKNGTISDKDLHYIDEDVYQGIKQYTISKDDIYMTIVGGTIGKCGLIPEEFHNMNLTENAAKITPLFVNKIFLWQCLASPFCQSQIIDKTKQVGVQKMALNRFSSSLIALPPFQEQEQIVAKLEELMSFCDGLEQSIKESHGYNEKLLQQVLREALQPKAETKEITLESRKIGQPLKTILAGHIINLNNTTDFGRVKFQKLFYLTEYCCKIDFDSNYVKKAAGPYDDELIKKIEVDFARLRFYNVVQDKTETKRVRYTALPGAKEMENLFLENYPEESLKINNLLMKLRPLNWGECEVVATIYAVWNNRIIKNEPVTDDLLYNDFMAWDAQKIKYKDIFYKKLFWMKEENIIADGWGKYVDKPNIKTS